MKTQFDKIYNLAQSYIVNRHECNSAIRVEALDLLKLLKTEVDLKNIDYKTVKPYVNALVAVVAIHSNTI